MLYHLLKPFHTLNKVLLILVGQFFTFNQVYCQSKEISLDEAILTAQKQSFDYKVAFNRYKSNMWNYENYRTSFLPTISMDGILPNYSRSINRITKSDGEDAFVSQNQAFTSLNFNLRQNVVATGGVVTIGSTVSRIDVFGNLARKNYSVVPISISYFQSTLGFNNFKWLRKTEPLRFESSKREFVSEMTEIANRTVKSYFNLISAQTQQVLSKQNLANTDTLYRIASDRFKLGTVSQSDLLQLRLNILNFRNQVRKDSIDYVLAKQELSRYLLIDLYDRLLVLPLNISFFEIDLQEAMKQAKENRKEVIDFRLSRLEAEKEIVKIKAENSLKFNVQANFGLTNTSSTIANIYLGLENQQNLTLSFSLPIVNWGYSKTQKFRAEADLAMVKNVIEQKEMQIEQEIALHISRWNLHQKIMESAIEAKQLAEKNYVIEVQRFKLGRISVNDLNISQSLKDNASINYVQAVRTYWELYYIIGRLTLYDFEKKRKMSFVDLID